ncbi:hypothetical protein Trydic_g4933 [Trypoxylus dichotomus]
MRHEVAYLGHIITDEGVKPNPEKVQIIQDFPTPTNVKEVKPFLGLVGYYRKFIRDLARKTKPLTSLLKKNATFDWATEQQESFDQLRGELLTEPILQYPDFSREFILTTDASQFAVGAVLSQGEIGKDLPIAFASRTLNDSETRYSTTERELLAIIWSTNVFRPYLYGRHFKIVTDHRPLTWLFNVKDSGSKLVRWRLKIEEYDCEIVYKPGREIGHTPREESVQKYCSRTLSGSTVNTANNESSTYINAVFVDSYQTASNLIVTQNPLSSTVPYFCRIVEEHATTLWLFSSLNRLNFDDPEDDVAIKLIQINSWDYGTVQPESLSDLIKIYEEMNHLGISSDKIILTCYDGARASGLFAALCFLIDRIKLEQICDVPLAVSTVRQSRKQFVTDMSQFSFLYKCPLEYVHKFDFYSNFDRSNR